MNNTGWQLQIYEGEYVEVHLLDDWQCKEKRKVLYLHDEIFLTCFVHPIDHRYLLYDCLDDETFYHYLKKHPTSQAQLCAWINIMIEAVELASPNPCLCSIKEMFWDPQKGQLKFIRLPILADENEAAIAQSIVEILECIDYSGDEQWLSSLYILCKKRPFRLIALKQFLSPKKAKRRFSFFSKKKEMDDDEFFKAFQVHEQFASYATDTDEKTTWMGQTDDTKTQMLSLNRCYGYFQDEKEQFYYIERESYLIGRQGDDPFCFNYSDVSKHHARLTIESGKCFVEDLSSTNGTYINGIKINEKVSIHDGDEIRLATHCFVYHADAL